MDLQDDNQLTLLDHQEEDQDQLRDDKVIPLENEDRLGKIKKENLILQPRHKIELQDGKFISVKVKNGCVNTRYFNVGQNLKGKDLLISPIISLSFGEDDIKENQKPQWLYGALCQPVVFFKDYQELPSDITLRISFKELEGDKIVVPVYETALDMEELRQMENDAKDHFVITKTWFKETLSLTNKDKSPEPPGFKLTNEYLDVPLAYKLHLDDKKPYGMFDIEVTLYFAPPNELVYNEDNQTWKHGNPKEVIDKLWDQATKEHNLLKKIGPFDLTHDITVYQLDPKIETDNQNKGKRLFYRYPLMTCDICNDGVYTEKDLIYRCRKCRKFFCKECIIKESIIKNNYGRDQYPTVLSHGVAKHATTILSVFDPTCQDCGIEEFLQYCIEDSSEYYCEKCIQRRYKFDKHNYKWCHNFVTFRKQIKKPKHSKEEARLKPYLWLSDSTYVALICQNLVCSPKGYISKVVCDVFASTTADIYADALDMFIGTFWEDPVVICKFALIIAKDRMDVGSPGDWKSVVENCQEKVSKMMNYLPSMDYGENYAEIASVIKRNYNDIFRQELKEITEHNAIYSIIMDRFWNRRNVGMYPLPFWCSPTGSWVLRSIFFFFFVSLLVFHVYSDSQAEVIFFQEHLIDHLQFGDEDGLGAISSIEDYWNWVNNTFLPGIYTAEPHFMIITDEIRIRQIRSDSVPCTSFLVPNVVERAPTCYPRARDQFGMWYPTEPSWKNVSLSSVGKSPVSSQISLYFYGAESYTVVLPTNYSVAQQKVNELIESEWIDWGTEAIIIEYLVYSPNPHLMAGGVVLTEITNVGKIKNSQDLLVVPETFIVQSFSWSSILLILYFVDFLAEELVDLGTVRRHASITSKRNGEGMFAMYFGSMWNVVDIIMIVTGFLYITIPHSTVNYLGNCNLTNFWSLTVPLQATQIAGSICIVMAFFRSLYYLTPFEFLGILILTIFNMIVDIMKFLVIFIIVIVGFASAFHLSYSALPDYSYFMDSFLVVFIGATSGYSLPDEDVNALDLSQPGFAVALQLLCVFIVIILMINLLIALMGQTYSDMNETSVTEYRWTMFSTLHQLQKAVWPTPFCLIHLFLALIVYIIIKTKSPNSDALYPAFRDSKERLPIPSLKKERKLFKEMAKKYLREQLEDDYDKTFEGWKEESE